MTQLQLAEDPAGQTAVRDSLWARMLGRAASIRRQDGAALAEYGLLVGFIAAVCFAAVTLFGTGVAGLFGTLGSV